MLNLEIIELVKSKYYIFQGVNHHCDEFKKSSEYHYIERTQECIPNCTSDITFTSKEKANAKLLTISLSATCFIISCITLITLIIDDHCCGFAASSQSRAAKNSIAQFAYAVPPFFSTFCCVFYSFGFLLSQLINPEDYCLKNDENTDVLLLAREGHRNLPCIFIYLLTYFFGLAISSWWTVIAVSWCVALSFSSSSSSSSSINQRNSSRLSTLCHLWGWGVPATLTVTGIVAHKVEADELLSVCSPGAGVNDLSLLGFILIPESLQVFLGLVFYIVGIILAAMRTTPSSNSGSSKRAKLDTKTVDRLQNRVLMYGAIYIIMKVIALGLLIFIHLSFLSETFCENT